jgi:hypothetical protein
MAQMGTFAETAIIHCQVSFVGQGNKLPFSVSICSKQTEVWHFHFPFAANKQKLSFSLS